MSSPYSPGPGDYNDPFASLRETEVENQGGAGRSKGPLYLLLGLAVVAVAVLGLVLLQRGGGETPTDPNADIAKVVTPALVGLTQDEALNRLAAAGLKPGSITAEPTDEFPVGEVMRQAPPAGAAVAPGSTVDFTVADEPIPLVPNLVGMNERDALSEIIAAGLVLGAVYEENSEEPEGTVLKQSKRPGVEAENGGVVDITVSNGKSRIPDVTGKSALEATTLLENAGFSVVIEEVPSSGAVGVLSSDPSEGTFAARGSLVTLAVAAEGADIPEPTPSPTVSAIPCDSLYFSQIISAQAPQYGAEFTGIVDYKCSGKWAVVEASFGKDPYTVFAKLVGRWDGSTWQIIPTLDACRAGSGLPASLYPLACSS